jgi:hypothetical protein
MTQHTETRFYALPQSFWGRLATGLLAISLVIAAFFFLFVVLIAAGVVVAALSLRAWWRARQLRGQVAKETIEGEYTVEVAAASRLADHSGDSAGRP